MTASARLTQFIAVLWRTDRALTFTALAMMAALGLFGAGLLIDPRLVGGAPVWLKPAKFAASIAIYTLTLTWIFQFLPDWPRLRRRVSRLTAMSLIAEIAIIAFQAARGVPSHFNVGTPLDATLFAIMGVAIVLQTLTSVAVAVALWRQPFARSRDWLGAPSRPGHHHRRRQSRRPDDAADRRAARVGTRDGTHGHLRRAHGRRR